MKHLDIYRLHTKKIMFNGLNQCTKLYYLANGSSGITKASNKVDSHVYKDFNFFCTFCFTFFSLSFSIK